MVPAPPPYPSKEESKNVTVRSKLNKRRLSNEKKDTPKEPEKQWNEIDELYEILSSSFIMMASEQEMRVYGGRVDPEKKNPTLRDCINAAEVIGKALIRKKVAKKYGEEYAQPMTIRSLDDLATFLIPGEDNEVGEIFRDGSFC